MPPLKISKMHHKHINNPFPSPPKSLPFIHGSISTNNGLPHHHHHHSYPIGEDFEMIWSSDNGGYLSISHKTNPKRSIWSTVPGEGFITAAAVETEVEESRGSFAIKDGDVFFISNHQSIEEIKVLYQSDVERRAAKDQNDFLSGFFPTDQELIHKQIKFPIAVVSGLILDRKNSSNSTDRGASLVRTKIFRNRRTGRTLFAARYWVLFDQKNSNQIGFRVKFGELNLQESQTASPKSSKVFQGLRWKLVRFRRLRIASFLSIRGFHKLPKDGRDEAKAFFLKCKEKEKNNVMVPIEVNRVFITYSCERDERFFGFGEQFTHVDFKGKRVPILVQEQGIGRGDQPITFAANLISHRSGGDWSTTYAPSPFYMTSKMRSLYLEGYNYSVFDLTKHDKVQIQIHGNSAQGRILNGNSPPELIECLTETIGRPPRLPNWIISGAVVGMQGGTETVRRVWDQLLQHDVPISAFWLQDWVGQRETVIGSQLWWNWEVDADRYAGWRQLVSDLRARDIRVMTYCNPCLSPTHMKTNKTRNHFEEAKKLDILVKDNHGETYMVPNTSFDVGMLDFTNPEATHWFKKILHEMVDSGVRGWMADFGEGLPLDANLFSGENPVAAHNQYPEIWAKVNREFVDEWKHSCTGKEGEDHDPDQESLVFFMRAGFRDSPKWAMLFWEGDQMVSWQHNDGIKSSVTGLLTSGLSGFAFNHSDIGGYCTVDFAMMRYRRTEELLLRWMELNAFGTVFRTHEGNNPASNCQFYSNASTMAHFARFAKVYKCWKFYRSQLVKEAAEKGLPVVRHLFIHYPDDEHVHSLTYQEFLVGTEILVVPVLDKGKKEVKAYFPGGGGCSWQNIWTGNIFFKTLNSSGIVNNQHGFEAWVEAPIGYPAVFVKHGSPVGETFLRNLKNLSLL